MLGENSSEAEEARIIDRLAIVEERLLAVKRDYFLKSITLFALFGTVGYWAWQSIPIALLTAFLPVSIASMAYSVERLLVAQERDEILFSYRGDMEDLHQGLAARRNINSIWARRSFYYGS